MNSESDLLKRLNIQEGATIAFTTSGGVKEFLRQYLKHFGASAIHGRGPEGRAETYESAWERIYKDSFDGKKKRVRK